MLPQADNKPGCHPGPLPIALENAVDDAEEPVNHMQDPSEKDLEIGSSGRLLASVRIGRGLVRIG